MFRLDRFHNARTAIWRFVTFAVLLTSLLTLDTMADTEPQLTTIAFGSCADDEFPNHPIWTAIAETRPDAMIFMGDNVYLDKVEVLASGTTKGFEPDYQRLANSDGFKRLREVTEFHATWDDNDYGANDGGREFELRETSQQAFFNFWGVDPESDRYKTPGVYGTGWIESDQGKIQIILTDSRYFRSAIEVGPPTVKCPFKNIVPTDDPEATMLGKEQWRWLEDRLTVDADLHILVSGIQVVANEHCFERWGAMPSERQRLLKAIDNASGPTIILSGDRHLGEISRLSAQDSGLGHDIYDTTSSSLSSSSGFGEGEPNSLRVGDNVRVNNFGLAKVDLANSEVAIELRDQKGTVLRSVTIQLGEEPNL
ncbi:MAG: alkaline phosphatase D family protein [Gammaproteobacteria bacterium]|nr:alkaline phosphatase D family protein [Gammaproteobacteria bacterium]